MENKEINIKLTVTDYVNFKYLKPFIELAEKLDYEVLFVDNGNIVFTKKNTTEEKK